MGWICSVPMKKHAEGFGVLCRLCVEGSDCAGSAIFGILAIEVFLLILRRRGN